MEPIAADRPVNVLKREHQVILRVLDVLERLLEPPSPDQGDGEPGHEELQVEPLTKCVEFFRLFADACHHAKEEDLLFPVLESRGVANEGGPIGVMLQEHQIARGLVQKMGQALDRVSRGENSAQTAIELRRVGHEYLELLRQHIFKEDNVLFMMGDQVMTDEDQSDLTTRFCEAGCKAFGGKRGEELEALADELERGWGQGA